MKNIKVIISLILIISIMLNFSAAASNREDEATEPDKQSILGDVDGDGEVKITDARLVLRYAVGLPITIEIDLAAADYNRDKTINTLDARYILRTALGLDPFAPPATTKLSETTTKPPETTTEAKRTGPYEFSERKFETGYIDGFYTNSARNVALYDYDNDKIIYSKNMNTRLEPASTTKVLTACLGCEYLDSDYVLTVGPELNLVEWNTSRAGLYQGQKIKFKEILKCLLAPSGCDAAYVIADEVARQVSKDYDMPAWEAIDYFVVLMNWYAGILGMNDSHFANPDGFPNYQHYTTAHDMMILTCKAFQFDLIRNVVNQAYTTARFENGSTYSYYNTNDLIQPGSGYYYPYCVGLKTGWHSGAGYCLLTVAQKTENGETRTFVCSTYGCGTKSGRYTDIIRLYNTAFSTAF